MKHIVGFSGGIDSQACAGWVLDRFHKDDVILLNTQAGRNEHPLTTEHIRWYSETVHPVIEVVPLVKDMAGRSTGKIAELGLSPDDELTFDLLAKIKGRFPSTKVRFCTSHLKLYPQLRWMSEHAELLASGYERYIGVRRDESEARSEVADREWDDTFDCYLNRPIAGWTKNECFDFVAGRGEVINPLYLMGFGRVGCAPCINSGKDDIRLWAARFPEMIDKIRAWEASVGRTFFQSMLPAGDAYYNALREWKDKHVVDGKPVNGAPKKPPRAYHGVDDIVQWSKTVHGGSQLSLPMVEAEADVGACVSKYGLCE